MAFTAKDVQALREKTGVGMMDCKKALVETDGDVDKAIEILREKGLATAAKKSGRIASEGIVKTYMSDDKKIAVLVEVNSETDFVAKNAEFNNFVETLKNIAVFFVVEFVIHMFGRVELNDNGCKKCMLKWQT